MSGPTRSQPYLETWLRRTRRQLATSGRLSELSLILARREGGEPSTWERQLRAILLGEAVPTLDLVTTIDASLAAPKRTETVASTGFLF